MFVCLFPCLLAFYLGRELRIQLVPVTDRVIAEALEALEFHAGRERFALKLVKALLCKKRSVTHVTRRWAGMRGRGGKGGGRGGWLCWVLPNPGDGSRTEPGDSPASSGAAVVGWGLLTAAEVGGKGSVNRGGRVKQRGGEWG